MSQASKVAKGDLEEPLLPDRSGPCARSSVLGNDLAGVVLPEGKRYHYFMSHKKTHSKFGGVPEQVAKNFHDSLEALGLRGWFDVDELQQITKDALADAGDEMVVLSIVQEHVLHRLVVQGRDARRGRAAPTGTGEREGCLPSG